MRKLKKEGELLNREIAKMFKVGRRTVDKIVSGRNWVHSYGD